MKKITFYKSMRNGKFIQDSGWYYKAVNGLEVVLHGGDKGWHWCATELTTGWSIPILGAKTLKETAQQIETIANSAQKFILNTKSARQIIEQRKALKLIA